MKVFTYGTLMRGCGNHGLLTDARLVGTAITQAVFTMLHLGGFPAIVAGGSTAIVGEVYEVTAEQLEQLDRLEGHPTFYRRTRVTLQDGTRASAYILQRETSWSQGEIESGDWRQADRRREMRS